MKILIIISGILGLGLFVFGWWGQYTKAGQKAFDEMAGILPFFAFYLGVILVALSFGLGLYKYFQN